MGAPEVLIKLEFIVVLVLTISPSFELKIMHCFFCWIPYSSRKIMSKFQIFFSTGSTGWEPVQPGHCANLFGALILVILKPKSYLVRAHKL